MRKLMNNNKMLFTLTGVSIAFIIILSSILVIIAFAQKAQGAEKVNILDNTEEVRGVWIASAFNIDFPSAPDLSEEQLKAELDKIVETTASAGLNTIFYQVRPASDALYKSALFPVSPYLSSNGTLTLDTLDYIIKAAHAKGIKVHAWVNPLRVTVKNSIAVDALPDGHPAKENPSWVVTYADGKAYYNCGIPEVRQFIADGIKEIALNYDVDGIVFDDYFYPYPVYETNDAGEKALAVFNDTDTFNTYKTGDGTDIADWRRENVNTMVKQVYDTVKEARSTCLFGVAPFGIWKNGTGSTDGSDTRGNESYSSIYCDTVAWIKGGYIDYVAPQLYWRASDTAASYNKLCDWWDAAVSDTNVRLLISHGAYRYESDWENPQGIMSTQVDYARNKSSYRGSVFYGYEEIELNTFSLASELAELYK